MSQILATGARLSVRRRVPARAAVTLLLARLPPRHLRTVLGVLRRGARPATYAQALAARRDVTASSAGRHCPLAGHRPAVPAHGRWPTWCTGVRTLSFTAHAWVEAEGRPVGEPTTPPAIAS